MVSFDCAKQCGVQSERRGGFRLTVLLHVHRKESPPPLPPLQAAEAAAAAAAAGDWAAVFEQERHTSLPGAAGPLTPALVLQELRR